MPVISVFQRRTKRAGEQQCKAKAYPRRYIYKEVTLHLITTLFLYYPDKVVVNCYRLLLNAIHNSPLTNLNLINKSKEQVTI